LVINSDEMSTILDFKTSMLHLPDALTSSAATVSQVVVLAGRWNLHGNETRLVRGVAGGRRGGFRRLGGFPPGLVSAGGAIPVTGSGWVVVEAGWPLPAPRRRHSIGDGGLR
jgi:hypothetical protein